MGRTDRVPRTDANLAPKDYRSYRALSNTKCSKDTFNFAYFCLNPDNGIFSISRDQHAIARDDALRQTSEFALPLAD